MARLTRVGTLELPEGMSLEFVDINATNRAVFGEGCAELFPGVDMSQPDWRLQLSWDLPDRQGSSTMPADPNVAVMAREAIERGATVYGQS